jgi:hypothetical protein
VFHNQQVVEASTEPRRPRKRPAEAPAEPRQAQPQQPVPRPAIPSKIEGATADEQIAFLVRWHAVIRERIPQRISDPARQQVLLALAERLDSAAWTDADEITAGLQQAAEALERLSHVFAKRRRRSKKRGGPAIEPTTPLVSNTESVDVLPDRVVEEEAGSSDEPSDDDSIPEV